MLQLLKHDLETNKWIIQELQKLDQEALFKTLEGMLHNDSSLIRSRAAEMLFRLFDRRATEVILFLLEDPEPSIRWHICGLLYDLADPQATPNLIKVLLHDPEPDVRLFAASALGKGGDASAIGPLQRAIDFDNGQDWEGRTVASAATWAIQDIMVRSAANIGPHAHDSIP